MFCNCDADWARWMADSGVLTKPEELGITQIFSLNQANLTLPAEGRIVLGPLQCVEASKESSFYRAIDTINSNQTLKRIKKKKQKKNRHAAVRGDVQITGFLHGSSRMASWGPCFQLPHVQFASHSPLPAAAASQASALPRSSSQRFQTTSSTLDYPDSFTKDYCSLTSQSKTNQSSYWTVSC